MFNLIVFFIVHTYLLLHYALSKVGYQAAQSSELSRKNGEEKTNRRVNFSMVFMEKNSLEDASFSSKMFSVIPRIYGNS